MPSPIKKTWENSDGTEGQAWQVRYFDRHGKRRSKQFVRKSDAKAFADTVTSDVRDGTHIPDRDTVTVAEAGKRWLAACEVGRNGRNPVEPHTLRTYEQYLRLHIEPALGRLLLPNLTPGRVKQFRDVDMLQGGRSRYMTKKCLTALSGICSEAVADELLAVNPCTKITLIGSGRNREENEVTIPSKDDVRALIEVARRWMEKSPAVEMIRYGKMVKIPKKMTKSRMRWWYTFLRFKVSTGCRMSEVRGASKSLLNLNSGKYKVHQRADEKGIIGPPKSAAGWRELDLDDGLIEDLDEWLKVAPEGDFLFPNGVSKAESPSNIYKRFWLPMLVEAGLATRHETAPGRFTHKVKFTAHDLRHFHASILIEAGMDPKPLQEHMGHSSIKVTMDTYGHLFKDDKAAARRRAVVTGAMAGLLEKPT